MSLLGVWMAASPDWKARQAAIEEILTDLVALEVAWAAYQARYPIAGPDLTAA